VAAPSGGHRPPLQASASAGSPSWRFFPERGAPAFLGVERAEGVRPQIRQNYADEGLFSVSARIRVIRGQFRIWLRRAAPGVFLLAKRLAICASG